KGCYEANFNGQISFNDVVSRLQSKQFFQSDWDIRFFCMVLLLVILVLIRCCCCCCCDDDKVNTHIHQTHLKENTSRSVMS
uniref:Uncharacterized protein n=1 Tax=Lates calcarifer TaxID=8187 RepID=A0A4W6D4G6_LATCA